MDSTGSAGEGELQSGNRGRALFCFAPIGVGTALAALWNPFWENSDALMASVLVASAFWVLAIRLACSDPASWTGENSRRETSWIVLGAIVLRALALCGDPGLSDDVHRYVWEGSLVADGISPYAFAPAAEEHRDRRERMAAIYADLNHPEVSAAYPPLLEGVLGAIVGAERSLGGSNDARAHQWMRVFFALCDLLVLWPLSILLDRFGRPRGALVTWAWCPLVVLEFAGSGHFDSLGILTLVGALALLTRSANASRWGDALGAVLASASVFIKLLPVCAVPFLVRGERRALRAAVLVGASLLWFVPFAFWEGGFASVGRGLAEYGTRWESFHFVYAWFEAGARAFVGTEQDRSLSDPRIVGRIVVGVLWLSWLMISLFRRRETVRAVGELIGLFLVLTPTLHPWYLLWVLPFVALRSSRPWIWVVATGVLLYAPLERWKLEQVWVVPAWTWPVIVIPFFALFAWSWHRSSRELASAPHTDEDSHR